jgi:triacylglycerol esterase/lipase EstA (alpha/beta hydrolase family)
MSVPVLFVHGIWDTGARFDTMRGALAIAGIDRGHALDLVPNDGRASIRAMAEQVDRAADALRESHGVERIDVVGFSMGALVSRYWIQRVGGRDRARRFVSISGPHAGTLTAHVTGVEAGREMRPGSDVLRDLAQDVDPWGVVEVHCMFTPLDLMIVPATSSILAGARTVRRFGVAIHRWMITDARVVAAVVATLRG